METIKYIEKKEKYQGGQIVLLEFKGFCHVSGKKKFGSMLPSTQKTYKLLTHSTNVSITV